MRQLIWLATKSSKHETTWRNSTFYPHCTERESNLHILKDSHHTISFGDSCKFAELFPVDEINLWRTCLLLHGVFVFTLSREYESCCTHVQRRASTTARITDLNNRQLAHESWNHETCQSCRVSALCCFTMSERMVN